MKIKEILNEGRNPKINHIDLDVHLNDLEDHEIQAAYSSVEHQLRPALGKDTEGSGIMLKLDQTEPESKIKFSAYGDERVFNKENLESLAKDFIAVLSRTLKRDVESNEYKANFKQFDSSKYPYMVSMEM